MVAGPPQPPHGDVAASPATAFRRRWDAVQGLRLHARVSSLPPARPGLPLVLVPGLGLSGRYLLPTARLLAPQYRIYLPDPPGFGLSAGPRQALTVAGLADALVAWMDAVDLERAAFLGNSMGCQVIIALAARCPQRVTRVVLNSPTIDRAARTALRQIWRVLRDVPRETPTQNVVVATDYLRAGVPRIWRTLGAALADPVAETLPHVAAPALVVRGSRDPIVPRPWAQEVARLLPQGRYVELPGAPHTAPYSTPAAFVRIVQPFLAEAGSERAL